MQYGGHFSNLTRPIPIPDEEEKLSEILIFHTSLLSLKRFYKGLHKTFWVTTKSVKIKI